jgi:acetylornithine/N-succinyldiaminopimelate aminotransferase
MTLAKGLGGGFPLAAMLAKRAVSCFTPGDQGATYSGHPLGGAVGLAVLREVGANSFLENVQRTGAHLMAGLTKLSKAHNAGRPRGAGLLQVLPLSAANAPAVVGRALERGLLINAPQPNLLRFMPALNVTTDEVDAMLGLLESALN